MKTRRVLVLGLISAFLLALSSCSKNKTTDLMDVTAPSVVVNSPEHMDHFNVNSQLIIDANFNDDVELTYYHIHIGDEPGNHVAEISYEVTGALSKSSYHFQDTLTIPDSLNAPYWLHFDVVDAESNVTSEKVMLHFNAIQ